MLARHPLAIAGALLTTLSAVAFIALTIAMLAGLFSNPYAGLVIFVFLPAVFLIGLVMIPVGMRLQRRKLLRDPDAVADWPVVDFRRADVRHSALIIAALTMVNLVIVLVAGYGSLHWMESPSFCGQVCHTPMHPQYTAWQSAPHSRVACVSCHIGEGPTAFVHAKLSGVRQLVQVATSSYPRPIPPGAEMPPGTQAETCRSCHQPERQSGDSIRVLREYGDDEKNPETITVLRMHLFSTAASPQTIHWHADPAVRVEYMATDPERETIPYVKVTRADGQVKEYVAPDTPTETIRAASLRTMDCVDCHNTVGHPIAATPEIAVDRAIAAARVSRDLPFARREGVRLLKASYPDQDAAAAAIEQGLRQFYQSQGVAADQEKLNRAVAAFQSLYRGNVFPTMSVTWGSYPDRSGHTTSTGCFRCHDEQHAAKDGSTISADCGYCHTQLETP